MKKMKLCLIINPMSGQAFRGINKFQPIGDIIDFFSQEKLPITIKITTQPGDGIVLTKESINEGYTHIIACGGDGTINEVVNGIVGTDVVMGIIPLGTENVLAKAMQVPLEATESCRHFLRSREKTWDVGIANGRHFLITSGIGLDGQVVSEMETEPVLKKALGSFGFLLKGAMLLFGEDEQNVPLAKIRLIDQDIEFNTRCRLIVVGNLSYYGGSVKLALKAKPTDGKLDIIVFPFADTVDTARFVLEAFTELHLDNSEVSYFTSSEFEISTEPPVYCQIDGELLGKTPVHYKIKPLAIKVKI